MAKEINRGHFLDEGETIRRDLSTTLKHMDIIDDWYFGKDLRLEGLQLQKEALILSHRLDQNIPKEAQTLKDIETAKDSRVHDIECQLKRKEVEFKHRLEKLRISHDAKTSKRVMELRRAIDDPSMEVENRKRLEGSVALEIMRAKKEWDVLANEINGELANQRTILNREIKSKENEAKLEIDFVRKRFREENETEEKKWRRATLMWLKIAQSKVASKS